jgi:hypothetical protein
MLAGPTPPKLNLFRESFTSELPILPFHPPGPETVKRAERRVERR